MRQYLNWFRGKIARVLAESFMALAVFSVVTVTVTLYLVGTVGENYSNAIIRTNLAFLGSQIHAESLAVVNLTELYVSHTSDSSARQKIQQEILGRRSNLDRIIAQAVNQTAVDDLIERTQLARIQEGVVNLTLQINRIIQAYDEEQTYGPNTAEEMDKLLYLYQQPLEEDIADFQEYEADRVRQVQNYVVGFTQIVLTLMVVLAGIAVIFATLVIMWMFRRIIIPLSGLHGAVEQLRKGRLDYPVIVHANDEIGLLAETLGEMAGQLRQTLDGLEAKIEELHQAKDALARSEEHYRSLYDGVPVGLFRSTQDGKIVDVNPAVVEMLAFPDRNALLGINALQLYEDPEARQRWRALAESSGGVKNYETPQKRYDGSSIWTRRTVRAVRDEAGNLLYYEGTLEDVTERKKAEDALQQLYAELEQRVVERTSELEAANKELESFAYSVSHDLRAPLRGIDGYSKLLMEEYGSVLSGDGLQYLSNVRRATQRMGQLIDDLLKLSRVSRVEMNRTRVDLSQLAREVLTSLQMQDPDRKCEVEIEPGLSVSADYNLVRVLIDNLLGNSWKFTSKKPLTQIKVGALIQNEQNVYYVRDNGAGFDMRFVEKLFSAFQRLHHTEDYDGTGIGLATAQRVVQRHGGRIWAEGQVEEGAVFYFTLSGR